MAESKLKRWCKEYSPDMGYKFVDKGNGNHYSLIKNGKTIVFGTLQEVQNHVLREMHEYIGKNTIVVDTTGKKIRRYKLR
jgi:hypothetical protein